MLIFEKIFKGEIIMFVIVASLTYGVIALCVFGYLLILSSMMLREQMKSISDVKRDEVDGMKSISLNMLSIFYYVVMVVIAVIWLPVLFCICILLIIRKDGTFANIPVLTERILLWFFLGFEKLNPTKIKQ